MARGNKNLGDAPYLLVHADGYKTLQQRWVVEGGLTVAQVKSTIVPNLFARLNALNWTDSEVMLMTVLPAYWNDWVISGNGGGQPINGIITSNNGVTVPAGVYLVNYPCITDGGQYFGAGTGFSGTVGGLVSMSTNLVYDRAGWLGGLGSGTTHIDGTYTSGGSTINIIFNQANLIQTTTWQVLSGSRSYTENGVIDGFRLTGDNGSWYNTGQRRSNGLGYFDPGETSKVGRIFAETFNGSGAVFVRGTPATMDELSSFQNAWSGIEFVGCDLSTININTLSGDDSPTMIGTSDGYGRVCSATININLIKSEAGKRSPIKGQIIYWNRDAAYNKLHIGAVQGNVSGVFIDSYFVVKNAPTGRHLISVDAFEGNNFRTVLHDVTASKRWAGIAYKPESFVYSYYNGQSRFSDLMTLTQVASTSVNANDRLGMVAVNGVFDYVNGTPLYDIYGGGTPPPPPPTCSWVVGAWSNFGACVNGVQTQTRSVTSSVPGCTPTDPMPTDTNTQPCNNPPPPVLPLFTRAPFNNGSASTSIDINDVANVKRITLTNVTFTDPTFSYQRLVVEAGTSPQGVRLRPQGNGGVFVGPGSVTVSMSTTPVVRNVVYPTLDLIFSSPITISRLLALQGTGSACQLTCEKLEFFAS